MSTPRLPFRPERAGPGARGPVLRKEIAPLLAGYWAFGQYWGVWAILVFEFLVDHGISESRIGVDYTILAITSVLVMVLVAPRLQPFALATTVPLSLLTVGVGAALLAVLRGDLVIAGFVVVGIGNGLTDVFLNVAAQGIEVRTRRPILQWMHACYALGGVTGALSAGLILAAGMDYRLGLAWAGTANLATGLWNSRTAPTDRNPGLAGRLSVSVFRRAPVLIVPAFVVLSAFLVEGSMDTWSGLYLRNELNASPFTAGIAFSAFAGSAFLGRLFASRRLFGLGYRRTILVAGVGSATGGVIAASTHSPMVAGLAFLLLGFSLASAAPAAFGLIEGSGEDPTTAIAAVTTVGYSGFIWSPPLLGWVAEAFSLRATMFVVVLATFGVLAGGIVAKNPEPRRE